MVNKQTKKKKKERKRKGAKPTLLFYLLHLTRDARAKKIVRVRNDDRAETEPYCTSTVLVPYCTVTRLDSTRFHFTLTTRSAVQWVRAASLEFIKSKVKSRKPKPSNKLKSKPRLTSPSRRHHHHMLCVHKGKKKNLGWYQGAKNNNRITGFLSDEPFFPRDFFGQSYAVHGNRQK